MTIDSTGDSFFEDSTAISGVESESAAFRVTRRRRTGVVVDLAFFSSAMR